MKTQYPLSEAELKHILDTRPVNWPESEDLYVGLVMAYHESIMDEISSAIIYQFSDICRIGIARLNAGEKPVVPITIGLKLDFGGVTVAQFHGDMSFKETHVHKTEFARSRDVAQTEIQFDDIMDKTAEEPEELETEETKGLLKNKGQPLKKKSKPVPSTRRDEEE